MKAPLDAGGGGRASRSSGGEPAKRDLLLEQRPVKRPGELGQSIGKPPARWRRWRSPLLLPAAGTLGMDARREAAVPRSGVFKWLLRRRKCRPRALGGQVASAAQSGGVRPDLCVYSGYVVYVCLPKLHGISKLYCRSCMFLVPGMKEMVTRVHPRRLR